MPITIWSPLNLIKVHSNRPIGTTGLSPFDHEEADIRMPLHLLHVSEQGHTKAYLKTGDTDVVVLAISFFQELSLTELWIGFGSGRTFKDIPVHNISHQLGRWRCIALPFFNAFSGCDVTSAMYGKGKKSLLGIHGNHFHKYQIQILQSLEIQIVLQLALTTCRI